MGATLTLLIRYTVGRDVEAAGWRIGFLYAANTAGAALGCILTDTVLVPAFGLFGTQALAVGLNLAAGAGALALVSADRTRDRAARSCGREEAPAPAGGSWRAAAAFTGLALGLTGFASMAHAGRLVPPPGRGARLLANVVQHGPVRDPDRDLARLAARERLRRRLRRPLALFAVAIALFVAEHPAAASLLLRRPR